MHLAQPFKVHKEQKTEARQVWLAPSLTVSCGTGGAFGFGSAYITQQSTMC